MRKLSECILISNGIWNKYIKVNISILIYIIMISIQTLNIIMSLLLGILLAVLTFSFLRHENLHGPDSNYFKTEIFNLDGKCYMFKPKMYLCSL
jgi:hypothetical protein